MKKLLAILSATAILLSFAACSQEKEEETTTLGESENTSQVEDVVKEDDTIEDETEAEAVTEVVTDESGETVTDKSGEAVTEKVTKKETDTTKKNNTTKVNKETEKEVAKHPKTKAEIISYCNTALNSVKSQKPGYSKRAVMQVNGNVDGLPSWLTSIFQKDDTTSSAKGENKNDDFPAAGFSWSSQLREQDVASATINVSGSTYDIMIKLGSEKNPKLGTASSYGRVMSVIDASEAASMVPGLKSVDMTYHDGYVHAKIDSKTGRVTFAEFSASADVAANISLIGDVKVNDIKSTETFTNFVW